MDARDLRVFEAVARLGGMNRAATELNTVQSNVTARIQALEAEVGCTLFERHGRGVSLTQAGHRLLPYAGELSRLLVDAMRRCPRRRCAARHTDDRVAGDNGCIAPDTAADALCADNPAVDLVLRTGTTCELIGDVLEQRVDGAFVCGPVAHPGPRRAGDVSGRNWWCWRRPTSRRSMPRWHTGEVRLVVLRAGCSYRQMLETLLARRGIVVQRLAGVRHAGGDLRLRQRRPWHHAAAARIGWRRVPGGAGQLHTLPPDDAMVDTVFVRRRDRFTSSALRAFLSVHALTRPRPLPGPSTGGLSANAEDNSQA